MFGLKEAAGGACIGQALLGGAWGDGKPGCSASILSQSEQVMLL